MKELRQIIRIECEIYKCDIEVIIGGTVEQANKRVLWRWPNFGDLTLDVVPEGRTYRPGNSADVIVWCELNENFQSILAHEAIHAAAHVLKFRGAKPDVDDGNEEAFGYLVEWIVREVNKKGRKLIRRKT